ncbi:MULTISPECIES: hypothetical protein [unclassified Streptomyces]|uniref:hypothetical protein n=1 Tax=unclassified Streptomyces TaxID=2593676 RepID=UPI0035D6AE99
MAESKRTTITQEVTETKKVLAVTLTLTIEEAEALQALVGSITGDAVRSPRKHTDSVYHALKGAGIRTLGKPVLRQLSGGTGWLSEPKPFSYSF